MSTNSSIQWTDATWNPVAGCSIVSPGCAHCYAMKMAARLEAMGQAKYAGLTKKVNGRAVWTGKITLDDEALLAPLSWKKPRRVFVNSMSDLFHEGVPFEFVDKVFAVMALCPQHTFQVLSKRPERMAEYLARVEHEAEEEEYIEERWLLVQFWNGVKDDTPEDRRCEEAYDGPINVGWPLPNVWLGTSCEDQKRADERIPHLLRCPAAVRLVSAEPLLGPIDLSRWVHPGVRPGVDVDIDGGQWPGGREPFEDRPPLHWLIVGGESGPGARSCNLDWIQLIVDQCYRSSVPCFVKQIGAKPHCESFKIANVWPVQEWTIGSTYRPRRLSDKKGGDPAEWPESLRVREFPSLNGPAHGALSSQVTS